MSSPHDVKFPKIKVKLTDEDGNVFSIIGRVSSHLKRAGHVEAASEFTKLAMKQKSYDDVLQLVMKWVNWD